ncbi:ROK family protein [Radiobacillus sp. PE A8.2]|uniref:ROK family protein n=1 Tax=Radiobacillus sp. PE A8.2 TaxID=3380349 RepID=UPI00388D81E4
MHQTWNQHVVKKENKTLVLKIIKEHAPISRAHIAQVTGLNKGTVSSLVSELLSEQLITESGHGQSSGGRRPMMLLFNEVAGYSIGLDLGVNYLLGMLTNLNGDVVIQRKIEFSSLSYEEITEKLFATIDELIASAPKSAYGIVGIGIGVPGIVDNEGTILLAPNLGWKKINLRKVLHQRYNLPITIENEANAGAYGEKMFGAGQSYKNIIYVSVGIGIGVGLILNGELYKGNKGFSGELGHMTIEVNGLACRCGNRGCWELYASEQALVKRVKELDILDNQDITLEKINELAHQGHSQIIDLLDDIGSYLGVGINNIINTFNPEQVIIGNRMAASNTWIKASMENRIFNYSLNFHQDDLIINFSSLTTHSAALGVAAFAIDNFLEVDLVQ